LHRGHPAAATPPERPRRPLSSLLGRSGPRIAAPILASRQGSPRQAAQAFREARDARDARAGDDDDIDSTLNGPVTALRAALVARPLISTSAEASRPRKDKKQALGSSHAWPSRGREGASGPQIAEAMGWAPHTVRGFLAGLAKNGITVDVLDRVRQVGPNKAGAKGSYTVYRFTKALRP
jgi:hypothetical protein